MAARRRREWGVREVRAGERERDRVKLGWSGSRDLRNTIAHAYPHDSPQAILYIFSLYRRIRNTSVGASACDS